MVVMSIAHHKGEAFGKKKTFLACGLAGLGVFLVAVFRKAPLLVKVDPVAADDMALASVEDMAVGKSSIVIRRKLQALPRIVTSKVGLPSETSQLWKNDFNVVHVVNTRFMQYQSHLEHLSMARLNLFETFTVPSMKRQTNHQFLWLIWVDGKAGLPESIQHGFLDDISDFPNAVVLAAKYDGHSNLRRLYDYSWTELSEAVIFGNTQLLVDYYEASKSHVLLETRLDADDALSSTFIESAQSLAAASPIGQGDDKRLIEYHCPEQHIEWRYFASDPFQSKADPSPSGHLVHFDNKDFCINTGLTTVFHIEFHDMRKLQVANCNMGGGGGGGGGGCPPVIGGRRLAVESPYNVRPNVVPNNEGCTPTFIPDMFETSVYHEPYDLHSDNKFGRNNVCPKGSWLCVGEASGDGSQVARGPTIAPEWFGSSDSLIIQCVPTGCTSETVLLQASVKARKKREVTSLKIDSLGDYKLIEVYMKAANPNAGGHGGGLTYDWINRDVTPEIVGGVFGDIFWTPLKRDGITRFGLSHTDICVAPHNPGPSCRRRLDVMPSSNININNARILPAVLMARTPTAAGMKHVIPKAGSNSTRSVRMDTFEGAQGDAWVQVHNDFGVDKASVIALREHFESDMEGILGDAIAGQCTPGHSCKPNVKKALGRLLALHHETKGNSHGKRKH